MYIGYNTLWSVTMLRYRRETRATLCVS